MQLTHEQLVRENLMRDSIKRLTEVDVDNTHCSPSLSGQSLHCRSLSSWSSMTSHFVNPCWLLLMIFLYLICLVMVPGISYSITFPGIKVKLIGLFPGSSFLPLLKIGVTRTFLQSSGTYLSCHDLRWPREVSRWHQPAPSALVSGLHQGHGLMYVQFAEVFSNLILK